MSDAHWADNIIDPDHELDEIRDLAAYVMSDELEPDYGIAQELAWRFEQLDDWMSSGRIPPKNWGAKTKGLT